MESYGKLLLYYAIPYFTISMVVELIYARVKGDSMRLMDAVASLSSGMSNILKDTMKISVSIISYAFLLKYVALAHWDKHAPWWIYLVCFIYLDFTGYWVHRIEHVINYFWNDHIIHHSSEEFNLACALRQPFSNFIGFFTIFLLPLALLGVPAGVIGIVAPIHLFMQFWYHTRYINRLGWLEQVIVTPSHHRVHHAMNDIYMDKNYGQIFIFWDKLFGTYQEELPGVEPVYGVRRPVKTWNPFIINFMHLYLLVQDAWRTQSYKDKLRIWFMPTGWRPADVVNKYPVNYVKDMAAFEKFSPAYTVTFTAWSFLQMIATLGMLCFFFYRLESLSRAEALEFGGFLLFSIFAYTSVMDKKAYGVVAVMVQAITGITVILLTGDWFGLKNLWAPGLTLVLVYLALTAITSIGFFFTEFERGIEEEAEATVETA